MISLILLAGGTGTRMGKGTPKQFRLLCGKTLALYSFEFFDHLDEIDEIIVVCDLVYRPLFASSRKPLFFANPGKRRQDSVYHGLLATNEKSDLICVHDSARPFVKKEPVLALLAEASKNGASALAIPATNTIKQADERGCVQKTLLRHEVWEAQTPQVIKRSLFFKAYEHALANLLHATDDLSLIEAIGHPTSLVKSSPTNFKITTPFDLAVAETLCASN